MKFTIPSLKIKKNDLYFIVAMSAFMEPALFTQFKIIDAVFLILKVVSAIYVLYELICSKISRFHITIVCYFGSLVLSTAINGGDVFQAIRTVTFNMLPCLFLDLMIQRNSTRTVILLRKICVAYVLINALLLIIVPDGFGKYIPGYSMTVDSRLNFLGRDNALIHFFIFALLVEFLRSRKKEQAYLMTAVMITTMLYVWSGTGVVVCVLITAFALLFQGKRIEHFFNIIDLTIAYIVIYCAIVAFRLQNLFSGIIVDVLHKDITFTGRTSLWDMAMWYIQKKPYIGYGITAKFLTMKSGISYSPHNLVLQIVLAGGFLSLLCFVIMYIASVKKISKRKYVYSSLLAVSIFCYLVASLTESTMNTQYFYLILVLAYNIDIIEKQKFQICEENKT